MSELLESEITVASQIWGTSFVESHKDEDWFKLLIERMISNLILSNKSLYRSVFDTALALKLYTPRGKI